MRVSGLCASWGHLILLKGSIARLDTRQRKFEPILIITEAKNAHFFVYKQTGFVHQRLRYFVKMTLTGVSCDWLWLESSRSVKNVTLIESPFFSTWLESSPSHQKPVLESSRITLQLQMSVIDWWKKLNKQYESNFFSPERTGNVEKKWVTTHSTSGLSPKHQTSEITLKTSDLMLMLKHQKWQHGHTPKIATSKKRNGKPMMHQKVGQIKQVERRQF